MKTGTETGDQQSATLRLLSREDCHLCEIAQRDLDILGVSFEVVDVDDDEELVRRYGDSIPVVLYGDVEIVRAPIERKDLQRALRQLKIEKATR